MTGRSFTYVRFNGRLYAIRDMSQATVHGPDHGAIQPHLRKMAAPSFD